VGSASSDASPGDVPSESCAAPRVAGGPQWRQNFPGRLLKERGLSRAVARRAVSPHSGVTRIYCIPDLSGSARIASASATTPRRPGRRRAPLAISRSRFGLILCFDFVHSCPHPYRTSESARSTRVSLERPAPSLRRGRYEARTSLLRVSLARSPKLGERTVPKEAESEVARAAPNRDVHVAAALDRMRAPYPAHRRRARPSCGPTIS